MKSALYTSSANLLNTSKALNQGPIDNLNRIGNPSARKLEAVINSGYSKSGSMLTSLTLRRATDPFLENKRRQKISQLEDVNTVASYLSPMQSVMELGDGSADSTLVSSINNFFNQVRILSLSTVHDNSMKRALLKEAENLSNKITEITSKNIELQYTINTQMRDSTNEVNSYIKSLFRLNQELRVSSSPIKLHDQRDILENNIAKFMDIKVIHDSSGESTLLSNKDGIAIVSPDNYVQFSNPVIGPIFSVESIKHYSPMTLLQYSREGKTFDKPIIFIGSDNDSNASPLGGQWGALVKLRKEILPQIMDTTLLVGQTITKSINDIHNNGSTFPPKSIFTSKIDVYGTQKFDWDPFIIYIINKEGNQLKGGAGLIHPIHINMNKMNDDQTRATLADMVKEINYALSHSPVSDRAAIGSIIDDKGDQITGEYLINNIQLKSNGKVAATNDNFSFKLDLQGNSHFGSNVELMSVAINNTNVINKTSQMIRLGQAENSITSMPFIVNGINNPSLLTIDIRITGDNGVVERGKITYEVNPTTIIKNDRISINTMTANHEGGFVNPNTIQNFKPIARARVIDKYGSEIDLNKNPNTLGRLVIETNNESHCLAMEGSIGKIFEFNNIFDFDSYNGKMAITPGVANDINQFATGQVTKGAGVAAAYHVGDVKAKATLSFTNQPENQNILVIGGETFIFVNSLTPEGSQNEILLGTDYISSLVKAINNNQNVSKIVTASHSNGLITIEANNPGSSSNISLNGGINVAFTLSGNSTAELNFNNAVSNSSELEADIGLIGGVDKVGLSSSYKYSIKSKSSEVIKNLSDLQFSKILFTGNGLMPAEKTSLSSLATLFTMILSRKLSEVEDEAKITATVLEQVQSDIQDRLGINGDEEFIKITEKNHLLKDSARAISVIQDIRTRIEDIICH